MTGSKRAVLVALGFILLVSSAMAALTSFIQMKDGCFYDPSAQAAWVPHGIAYQTWNRPLGVWQTQDQIIYDLDQMKKMGANSIRVDFVWQHIEEQGDNVWSWTNYDFLVSAAEDRGIRVFALVGYQWPPSWFPDSYYTMHPPGLDNEGIMHTNRWQSDIIGYENPSARAQYSNFIYTVCNRYKDSKAIAGWIIGNEYGYLGLWSLKYDGYDSYCEAAFRTWCTAKYGTIATLNTAWGTAYTNFSQIILVDQYSWKGTSGAEWADMVQWHEDSIASFTAMGASAARSGDTNHMLAYSTVGMQWGEEDWRYHAEDRGKIARACASNSAALSYYAVNNYPWAMDGSETRNGQWGISYTKKTAGVPVIYSETGFTSSETLFPGMTLDRQGILIRNSLWECLAAGGIGAHVFTWQDRPWITDREKGFGILYGDRSIKPAFWTTHDAFNLMEQAKIGELLAGSQDPKPDVAFLWDDATDSQYIRFENEMQHEAGALERLGFEPNFILGLGELSSGAYTNYKAIILPRNMRVSDTVPGYTNSVLNFLLTQVIPKGIHVIAVADLPGMQDRWGKPRAAFSNEMTQLFGVDASDVGGFQPAGTMNDSIYQDFYRKIAIQYTTNAPAALANYSYSPSAWKCSDRVKVTGGTLWAKTDGAANRGYEASSSSTPSWNTWGNVAVRQWGWQYEGTNMVQLWGWAGMWQDFQACPGQKYTADAYMRNNSDDGLSNGTFGVIAIEWYDANTNLIGSPLESARLTAANNAWQYFSVSGISPSNVSFGRIIRKLDRQTNSPIGSLYFDSDTMVPAVVAKDFGTAKAVLVLHSLDCLPDGDGDGWPDNLPYKWRYDILGTILKDYCGVQPAISATGTNAYLCLPEYRTCTNGGVLIQVKNYLYDYNNSTGGASQTFTIQSTQLVGKTIRAFEQGRILSTNSNGTITLTLQPDGQEILYAYSLGTNRAEIVQITDVPSVVHPFGDKAYSLKVKYDCLARTDLRVRIAFQENGDNGDGVTNEIYQVLTNTVTGYGTQAFNMWIPDANQADSDYKSTAEGGKYQFSAWLETTAGVSVAQSVPAPTVLEWGIRPTNSLSSTLSKGQAVTMNLKWEDLYESLPWRNTPEARNEAFPGRVAVYRSLKTEAQFPGHLAKVNEVCEWLNSLGYSQANPLDIGFDNVIVTGLFSNDFNNGAVSAWTRAAGALNWGASAATNAYLRMWRIGNDDNIVTAGTSTWGAVTMSADVCYNKQDPYFSDIELYPKYVDRNNYYKVGIRNYYGFWRLRFLARVNGVIQQQGWLTEFPKTNKPVENVWYNLKVVQAGSTNSVYFNNTLVGTFYATNFPTGKIALGSKASQLGIWEPQKGYFFIDDDENGYSADPNTNGPALNLDWGYLQQFFPTLVLPGVYAMNDTETLNLKTWITNGVHSVLATDGSVAMRDETGAVDLGRVESLFGVSAAVGSITSVTQVVIGTNDHYVTLDYPAGSVVTASGNGKPYTALAGGRALATVKNSGSLPGLIANIVTNNPGAPAKVLVFNFDVDTGGQLTNGLKTLAKRAFEWSRNDAYKVRIELKYANPNGNPNEDFVVYVTNGWILAGSGMTNLIVNLPSDGLMTGDGKFYWGIYTYPWDSTNVNGWLDHNGFYSSGNDGIPRASIAGKGLEILGVTDKAFAGRDWDMWAAYNTRTTTVTLTYGIKDKGAIQDEDNFNDGDYVGWNIVPNANIGWSVSNGALRASVLSTGGYAYIYRSGLTTTGQNVSVEYDTLFGGGAYDGGLIYRGRVLYVSPNTCGWADNNPNYYATNRPTTGTWSHVVVNIRDGVPYPLSDLAVNGRVVFLSEPVEATNWTTNTVGFLSPYSNVNAYVQWDNVRVADEQYSLAFTNVLGEYVPNSVTNPTFWPSVPDYDPDMLEHDGTAGGAQYEWYLYARGEGLHSYKDGTVYFSPRLVTESASFPTNLTIGANVSVPVQWENLSATQVPARLRLRLFDGFSGVIYVDATSTVSIVSGSTNIGVTVPTMPSGSNYVWSTFLYLTNAVDAWKERIGSDDTFRFNEAGIGVEPETRVTLVGPPTTNNTLQVYSDAGTPAGSSLFTWYGAAATFNGNYADATAPEGTMSFSTTGTLWQGWGVFLSTNLSAYSNGYLKFWVKSTTQLKVDLEGPQNTKATKYIASTTNQWQQFIIAITNFAGVQITNMYGLFEITGESAGQFFVDNVRWDLSATSPNQAPVVNAGNAQTITLPSTATLNGTATDDGQPSNALTVAWTKVSGPGTVTFTNSATANTRASFSTNGVYVLRLTANDTALQSYSEVQITVNPAPVNQPPVVSAKPDQTITLPSTVTLAGTATDDGLPSGVLNITWSKLSGPGTVTFTNAATANTQASFSTNGVYILQLSASDTLLTSNDTVQITVNAAPVTNQPPVVNAGNDQTITLPLTATLAGTATDDGQPSNILTVAWSKVSGPGTVTFTNAATANTRASFSTNGVYVLQLSGSDSVLTSNDTVQITVNPVPSTNSAPVVNAGNDQTITLPSMATLAGTVTDDGLPSNVLAVAWTKVSGPGTVTFTNAATANTKASFSTNGVYVLQLSGSDGALTSNDTVQITVNPVNQPPVVNAGNDQTITLPSTATLAGTATDDGQPSNILTVTWSKVSGPGTVTFTNAATANTRASFSTNGVYILQLSGSDSALTSNDTVQITVNLANQPPVVSAKPDQTITLPSMVTLAGTVTDDGLPSNYLSIAWSKVSGPGTVTFTNAATANTKASFSTNGVYVLQLSAYDGALTSNDTVQITVNPAPTGLVADLSINSLVFGRPIDSGLKTFTNCSYNIVNNGPTGLTSEWVFTEYYLSLDTTFGNGDDKKVGDTGFTLDIPSGSYYPIVLTSIGLSNMTRFWSQSLVTNGTYYLFARVSVTDGSPSDPTSTNDYAQGASFSFNPLQADLAVTSLTVGRPIDSGLKTFTNCSFNIVNNGPTLVTNESIFVDYYLSSDTTFGNGDDKKIGDTGFGLTIPSGSYYPIALTSIGLSNMSRFWNQSLVTGGTYYVFASARVVDESPYDPNFTNNSAGTAAAFTFAPLPADIRLFNLAVGRPADSGLRTFTNCSFTIVNNGPTTVTNESFAIEYFLSLDTVFGAEDTKIGDTTMTLSMSAGYGWNISLSTLGLTNMTRFWTELLLPTSNYYVFAKARVIDESPYDPTSTNDYGRTSATFPFVPEVPLTVNAAYTNGNIAVANDADWYSFSVSTTNAVTIDTQAGTLTDDYMYLYGPNSHSTLVESDDDDGTGYMAMINRSLTPGTYFVRIRGYSAAYVGTYTIRVTQ